jgi:serine/threonine-protein kinase
VVNAPGPRPDDPPAPFAFETLVELGEGGMGKVFLARVRATAGFERLVVVKRMHGRLLDRPEAVGRFLDEARTAAHVRHANVVGVHHVGKDAEGYFLVQDYVEGESLEGLGLRAALKREALSPSIVLRVALDTLAGLHAVHEAKDPHGLALGILHRDVSVQNILVGRDGVARLADFGVAKSRIASVETDRRYLIGKLPYLAPETLRRDVVDRRVDVYAVGVCVWIALVGREPWELDSEALVLRRITEEGLPSLASAGVRVAPVVEALVARACARDAADRFATAHAMAEAIEHIGRHTGWVAAHGEVAALVERLAGVDLRRRAELVASRVASLDVAPPAPAAAARAPGSTSATAFARTPREGTAAPSATRRRLGAYAGVFGALALGLALLRATTPATTAPGTSHASAEPAASLASLPASASPPTPATSAPSAPAPAAALDAGAPAQATAARPSSSHAPPSAHAGPAPARSTAAPSPLGAPTEIATANPYR